MSKISESYLYNLVESVCKKKNISKYSVKINIGTQKGDGYFGSIFAADVVDETTQEEHSFILKCAPTGETLRSRIPIGLFYGIEISFYENVYPLIKELQSASGIKNPFNNVPNCFLTNNKNNEEFLVLENMQQLNYKMYNRKKLMPENHIVLVLETIAKFHALSIPLQELKPEFFEEMKKTSRNLMAGWKEGGFVNIMEKRLKHILNCFDPITDKEFYGNFKIFVDNCKEYLNKIFNKENPRDVIIHGDCWCNNCLFKYEDDETSNTPSNIIFVDFQFVQIGNCIRDIALYLFTATSSKTLENYEQYLKIYYKQFSKTVKDFGLDLDKAFSFTGLMEDYKMYSKFMLMLSCQHLCAILKDDDEIVDMEALVSSKDENSVVNVCDIRNKVELLNRIRGIISHITAIGGFD